MSVAVRTDESVVCTRLDGPDDGSGTCHRKSGRYSARGSSERGNEKTGAGGTGDDGRTGAVVPAEFSIARASKTNEMPHAIKSGYAHGEEPTYFNAKRPTRDTVMTPAHRRGVARAPLNMQNYRRAARTRTYPRTVGGAA
jgi:hypothetical protein